MDTASHTTFIANAIKTLIKALAYSIVNIMKRFILPKDMQKSRLLSIRNNLIKIACRCVKSGRKTIFKLCKNSPYQNIFGIIVQNIESVAFS